MFAVAKAWCTHNTRTAITYKMSTRIMFSSHLRHDDYMICEMYLTHTESCRANLEIMKCANPRVASVYMFTITKYLVFFAPLWFTKRTYHAITLNTLCLPPGRRRRRGDPRPARIAGAESHQHLLPQRGGDAQRHDDDAGL